MTNTEMEETFSMIDRCIAVARKAMRNDAARRYLSGAQRYNLGIVARLEGSK